MSHKFPRLDLYHMVRTAPKIRETVRDLGRRDHQALPQIQHPITRPGILGKERSGKAGFSAGISFLRIGPVRCRHHRRH